MWVNQQLNTYKKSIRGGLTERWVQAQKSNCEYIEVPATLIKNKTEERITGLEIGDFLTKNEISQFYLKETLPNDLKYILHTEPSLSKTNSEGRKIQPPIKWYDQTWTQRYLEMVIQITEHLSKPAEIIEIHPGYNKNTYQNICEMVENLIEVYQAKYGFRPLVLLENRTEQFISRGKDIKELWSYLLSDFPHLEKAFGVVLDIQQLKSKTKDNFHREFDLIPLDSLKGFHIHTRHRWPTFNDRIPWRFVFGRISEIKHDFIINPEIHQQKKVQQTINFCEDLLNPK